MSSAPPPTRVSDLPFVDARGCKEWLNALALTNIPQAQAEVLEMLQALAASGLDGLERLKCLELARDKVAFLQGEQRSRYFGKTIPLSANDAHAWETGRSLLQALEDGYRKCREQAAAQPELAAHGALVSQRVVRYIGAQMLYHAMVYRRFDPQLWTRLHQEYAAAEAAGHVAAPVRDSLEGGDGPSSVAMAYAHVVLMQAAFLSEMRAPQTDFAEALARMWVPKVRILAAPAEGDATLVDALVVDPAKDIGARPQPRPDFQPGQRIVDTKELGKSIRRRIHGLKQGEDVATLGLPPQASAVDPLDELKRLNKLWCEGAAPRPPGKLSKEEKAGLVFGFNDIHFFVTGGKVFEQPDKKREMTSQEKQDIEVFGRITERTQSKMRADHTYSVEAWPVVDEMFGAVRVLRPATTSRGIGIGRLVALRLGDTAPFFLGIVREMVQETDGRIIATVAFYPGRPEAIPVRAADARNRRDSQWMAGFRLPALEKINVPASTVVPSGVAARGRGIDFWADGASHQSTVEDVLERGSDFDRIAVF